MPYWACKTSSLGDSLAGTRNSCICKCRCYFLLSQCYEEHTVTLLLPTAWGAPRATDSALSNAVVGKRQRRWFCVPHTQAMAHHSSLHSRRGHEQRPSSFYFKQPRCSNRTLASLQSFLCNLFTETCPSSPKSVLNLAVKSRSEEHPTYTHKIY